jgi:hypothetical protein
MLAASNVYWRNFRPTRSVLCAAKINREPRLPSSDDGMRSGPPERGSVLIRNPDEKVIVFVHNPPVFHPEVKVDWIQARVFRFGAWGEIEKKVTVLGGCISE